jgi:Undecaprenyl-phosphate galactose phosphotransferase WbaP
MMHYILSKTKLGGIPAVIFGSGSTSRLVIDRLRNSKRTGYVPVLLLDDDLSGEDLYHDIPVIHNLNIGPEIVKRFKIRVAIVAMPKFEQKELTKLLNDSVSAFRYSVLVPDFFNVTNIWMSVRDFDGVLGFVTSHRLRMFWNLGIKRLMDLVIVTIGGLVLLPLFLTISLLVKISSTGPVLYGHKRLGQNGKSFTAYKFRSMVQNSNEILAALLKSDPGLREEWLKNHKLKNDPRVTRVGKFLRRTSFDEFPQLINILKGEMSLVGPRPIVDEEVEKYGEDFNRIFSVRPGLTGLWQVSGRSDTDYGERISFDTYYLQSWSVWLDIWILYRTFGVVFRGKGAY